MTDTSEQSTASFDPDEFIEELDGRLSGEPAIEPGPLADLFNLAMGAGPVRAKMLAVLRAFLLRRTVEHARTSTHYYGSRPVYAERARVPPGDAPVLAKWPTITRETVIENFSAFLARGVRLRSVCHTSGTTGQPLEIYKSYEEVSFNQAFLTALFRPFLEKLASRPLTLSFPTPHHGVAVPLPGPGMVFVSGVTDDTLIQDAVRILRTSYNIPGHDSRISILSGMGFQLLFFTSYLREQGIDPRGFGLKAVNFAGGFMPAHWRQFLEHSWGATVHDRFSLTESAAGASRCSECGCFHPDPHLIAEAVDFDGGETIERGIGRLVITNLYPFVQMLPLIRYETGDLVELGECSSSREPVIRFLGRSSNAISHVVRGSRRWLIFSSELHEVLATLPDLNVYDWFSNVRAVRDRTVGSLPIMSARASNSGQGPLEIVFSAELRYAPHCYPERLNELQQRILNHLIAVQGSSLREDLATGAASFEFRFLPPSALKDPYVIKV